MVGANLLRRLGALRRLRRGHPHVDDRHVGLPPPHRLSQLVAVRRLADDVEAALGQHAREALAHEHRVLRDHDPHGISPTMRVPLPESLSMRSEPPCASTRSIRPRSPEPRAALAPPTPLSLTSITSVESSCRAPSVAHVACACFATFVSASDATK